MSDVYLLYLDESGTHAAAPVFVLSGLAIHENDAYYLQRRLHRQVASSLRPLGLDPTNFELHANELRAADKDLQARPGAGPRKSKPASPWLAVPEATRRDLLNNAMRSVATFRSQDESLPFGLFGAVVDASYQNREERAYELVLNKFDEFLDQLYRHNGGARTRGLVLHDVRQKQERGIQVWTNRWRERAGNVGMLHNLVDVPVFLDSKASRIIQAADLVSYALWRYYSSTSEDRYVRAFWPRFHNSKGQMHGLIHVTPKFARRECGCPPCLNRVGPASLTASTVLGTSPQSGP